MTSCTTTENYITYISKTYRTKRKYIPLISFTHFYELVKEHLNLDVWEIIYKMSSPRFRLLGNCTIKSNGSWLTDVKINTIYYFEKDNTYYYSISYSLGVLKYFPENEILTIKN